MSLLELGGRRQNIVVAALLADADPGSIIGRTSSASTYRRSRQQRGAAGRSHQKEAANDPQARIRRIPALFAQDQSQDRQAPQPRHLQVARRGGEARARGAVLQAPLIGWTDGHGATGSLSDRPDRP